MDKKFGVMQISGDVKRSARKMTREEIRDDLEMLLSAVYHGDCTQDKELLRSSEKDLRKAELQLVCKTFYEKGEAKNEKTD